MAARIEKGLMMVVQFKLDSSELLSLQRVLSRAVTQCNIEFS